MRIVCIRELIDTQWDVNITGGQEMARINRINRYIVGCKCTANMNISQNENELIDTQWDVNLNR